MLTVFHPAVLPPVSLYHVGGVLFYELDRLVIHNSIFDTHTFRCGDYHIHLCAVSFPCMRACNPVCMHRVAAFSDDMSGFLSKAGKSSATNWTGSSGLCDA